ncbi:hypothetical protein IQ06DRAFT_357580 [Phaeosphaeriaceae sp. SRC1lsM3a]|nr:hypothetical protein IQ06DRAFT_357580 [Stagonospora sp. SRC1lsM3a]
MKLLAPLSALLASATAVELSTVYQFPNGTWLENLAQMRNGSLLVTVIRSADVYIINNVGIAAETATASLVASFPGHNAVLGITEMQKNVFAVAVGNVTESNAPVEGTFGVYSLNLTEDCAATTSSSHAGAGKVSKIVDLPEQGLLNGIAFDPPSTLLLADSWKGEIVRLNASSGAVDGIIENAALKSNFSSPSLVIGVNGLRIHNDFLYFSNTVQNLLGRIDLDSVYNASSSSAGKVDVDVQIIAQGSKISQPDDFAVLHGGSVLVVRPLADTLQHVGLDGKVEEIARGGVVSGGTSLVLSKTKGKGKKVAYVSTSGLKGGASVEGGRVVRVEY